MFDYLLVTDKIAPLSDSEDAIGALGLATALAARPSAGTAPARVSVLAQASPEVLARQTGLARRLRPVPIELPSESARPPFEVPLYEGRPTAGAAHVFVLGVAPGTRADATALLGAAANALVRDGVIRADVVIGWGEPSARALAALPSARRLLVVPTGRAGAPLTADERVLLGGADGLEDEATDSLLGQAAMEADAVVVPSPSAARETAAHPGLAGRPSDQPLVVVRLGCDEPPHDPSSDPALAHHYSASDPAGKAECRKALARRLALAVGPRTLLVVTAPLVAGPGTEALLNALGQLGGLEVAMVLLTGSDRSLAERARILAIQNPGRMAVVDEASINPRELLAGADAALFTAAGDLTGRTAGLALRYGALPITPDAGAYGDFLVDYDARSATGTALLYAAHDSFELAGAIRRAVALRTERERWDALVTAMLTSAPSWRDTSARLESLAEEAAKDVATPLLA